MADVHKCAQRVCLAEIARLDGGWFDVCKIVSLPHRECPSCYTHACCDVVALFRHLVVEVLCGSRFLFMVGCQDSCLLWLALRCRSKVSTFPSEVSPSSRLNHKFKLPPAFLPPWSGAVLILSQTLPACPRDCILYHKSFLLFLFLFPVTIVIYLHT